MCVWGGGGGGGGGGRELIVHYHFPSTFFCTANCKTEYTVQNHIVCKIHCGELSTCAQTLNQSIYLILYVCVYPVACIYTPHAQQWPAVRCANSCKYKHACSNGLLLY